MINAHLLASSYFPILTGQVFTFTNEVQAVVKSNSGKLWIAGSGGTSTTANGYIANKEVADSAFTAVISHLGTGGEQEGFFAALKTVSGKLIFGNNRNRIYVTLDETSFTQFNPLFTNSQFRAFIQLASGKILIGAYFLDGLNLGEARIYSSTNDLTSIALVVSNLDSLAVFCFIQLANGIVLAGTGDSLNVYKSTDSNATAFNLTYNDTQTNRATQFCQLDNGDVLLSYMTPGIYAGGILKSIDNGSNFTSLYTNNSFKIVGLLKHAGLLWATFVSATASELRYSNDNGVTWEVATTLPHFARQQLSIIDNKIAVCHTGGVTLFTVN